MRRPIQKAYQAIMAQLPLRERYVGIDAELREELLEDYLSDDAHPRTWVGG